MRIEELRLEEHRLVTCLRPQFVFADAKERISRLLNQLWAIVTRTAKRALGNDVSMDVYAKTHFLFFLRAFHAATTCCCCSPRFWIPRRITSPGRRNTGSGF